MLDISSVESLLVLMNVFVCHLYMANLNSVTLPRCNLIKAQNARTYVWLNISSDNEVSMERAVLFTNRAAYIPVYFRTHPSKCSTCEPI